MQFHFGHLVLMVAIGLLMGGLIGTVVVVALVKTRMHETASAAKEKFKLEITRLMSERDALRAALLVAQSSRAEVAADAGSAASSRLRGLVPDLAQPVRAAFVRKEPSLEVVLALRAQVLVHQEEFADTVPSSPWLVDNFSDQLPAKTTTRAHQPDPWMHTEPAALYCPSAALL